MVLRTEPEQLAWIQWQCNRLDLLDTDATVLGSGVIKTHRKPGHPITIALPSLRALPSLAIQLNSARAFVLASAMPGCLAWGIHSGPCIAQGGGVGVAGSRPAHAGMLLETPGAGCPCRI